MNFIPLITLFFASTLFAQTPSLEESLESIRTKYNLPSLSAAFLQDGKITDIASTGVRKVGHEAKVTTEDKFHLGSCTKSMTATLAAIFIDEGKLKWESTLPELFPELEIHESYKTVTFDMLLSHRSGMHRGLDTKFDERGEAVAYLLKKGSEFKPDSVDKYSNSGYLTAAHVLERISGKSWEVLIQEKLFNPLEMKSCGFGLTAPDSSEAIPSQPWPHYSNKGVITPLNEDNDEIWGPAGRVHCALRDWAKYLKLHIDGFNGKSSLVSIKSFSKLQSVFPSSQMYYTAGGWFRLERQWASGAALTHNGTNLANYARVWIAPIKNAAIMVVTNMGGDETFKGDSETLNQTGLATNEAVGVLIDRHLKP